MFNARFLLAGAVLVGGVSFGLSASAQNAARRPRQFSPGQLNSPQELPHGRFRSQLEQLPAPARDRAVAWLRGFHFTEHDLETMHIDAEGGVFYADQFTLEPATEQPTEESPQSAAGAVPVIPFPAGLKFHSRPGAANVIYLDFDGETVTGTSWNSSLGRSVIQAVPFSADTDHMTFSDAEQLAIKRVWQRVAEDYAPFDVDVTTERPASFTSRTAHALITRSTDESGAQNPSSTAGGVAYVNVFGTQNFGSRRPAWVYSSNLSNNEAYVAEATSHEIGHNLGLSHDGNSSRGYYGGHGSGDTSWGPLMGTGYGRNVSQWSKGEYFDANNTEDDLAIIAGKIVWRTDDHGSTTGTATPLAVANGTNVVCTTLEDDPANANRANKGVIERNTDSDMFSFTTGIGPVNLKVRPWVSPAATRGGNLDLLAELMDQNGALLMVADDVATTEAAIQTNLPAGLYHLRVRNTGTGNPMTSTASGYTAYGSIGLYFVSGTIAPPSKVESSAVEFAAVASPSAGGCVTPSSGAITSGKTVELLATPAPYYRFVQWSGGATGTQNPLTLTLTTNTSITAEFEEMTTTAHGTPYSWLASMGYTNNYETAAESVGANGIRVWESYVAGLDPRDPNSQLRVALAAGKTPGQWTVGWSTVPGRLYTVLWSANVGGPFLAVPGATDLAASVTNMTANSGTGQIGFFRLSVKPQ